MMALHLIRVPVDVGTLARWAGDRGWARRGGRQVGFDEGRALHHLLHEVFGPGAFRTFRLLVAARRTAGNLYGYSESSSDELRSLAEAYAFPDQLRVLTPRRIEGKPMPTAWRVGQRLGFDVRVRPVRRLLKDLATPEGSFARGAEVDAFLVDALRRRPRRPNSDEPPTDEQTRQEAYLPWLAERMGSAVELELASSRVARFRRIRVSRQGRAPEGPDVTIHGTLTVREPEGFAALVRRGVGRHKAYGYGMVLLRPPASVVPTR